MSIGLELLLLDYSLVFGEKFAFENVQSMEFPEEQGSGSNGIRKAIVGFIREVGVMIDSAPAKSKLYSRSNARSTGEDSSQTQRADKAAATFVLSEKAAKIFAGACLNLCQSLGKRFIVQAFGSPSVDKAVNVSR